MKTTEELWDIVLSVLAPDRLRDFLSARPEELFRCGNAMLCPVAQLVAHALPDYQVYVDMLGVMLFYRGGYVCSVPCLDWVTEFMERFDNVHAGHPLFDTVRGARAEAILRDMAAEGVIDPLTGV
jgi:hypothetical protein